MLREFQEPSKASSPFGFVELYAQNAGGILVHQVGWLTLAEIRAQNARGILAH